MTIAEYLKVYDNIFTSLRNAVSFDSYNITPNEQDGINARVNQLEDFIVGIYKKHDKSQTSPAQ